MEYWQSYKLVVLLILGIINLEEKRGLRNIALIKETLSTHSGRKGKETMNNKVIILLFYYISMTFKKNVEKSL